ncbi:MAG: hypothetical protein EOP29_22965 [Rhodococcus sp. (in: high G+C Gram-positive bacteria)]|nr:MAG: hypothetical protein EOP29_22965 [Rhodococcus sp. (in: high G+C Gram-positive bacteria)]
MRRFIASLPGKVFSQLVILALLLPTLTFALITRASAQVATLPVWAVVEFANRKSAGTPFGKNAAAAVITELAKTGRYELVPQENIQRAIEAIGVETPPKGQTNLLRLGQEVRANTLVQGEIVDYTVKTVNGNKQGLVSMLVVLYDVASGLPVNGVAVGGQSTERASNTADDVLITDAIVQAANKAVRELQMKTLPQATVQNTTTYGAFINQGDRSGFKPNMPVIVTRGRQQVATARVTEVEPDSAQIRIERGNQGIQPGDKVRAIFDIPTIGTGFNNQNEANIKKSRPKGNPSGLLTVLIVLGIVALLLSSGNSGSQNAAENVVNEAINDPSLGNNASGVKIRWSGNGFYNGQQQQFRWLIYRSDIADTPVMSVAGSSRDARNTSNQTATSFAYLQNGVAGGVDCFPNESNASAITQPVTTGRPYTYSVSLVYRVLNLDLPDGGNSGGQTGGATGGNTGTTSTAGTTTTTTAGTTGTTATGTTATTTGTTATTTGTTATTTGTTATTGTTGTGQTYQYCYFVSSRQSASGPATPLQKPGLTAPAVNAELSSDQTFTFTTVGNIEFPSAIEYVLEFSSTIDFRPGTWAQVGKQTISQAVTPNTPRTFPSIPVSGTRIPSILQKATLIYWRVGAKNIIDRPGPEQSANGQRYVYSYPPSSYRPATAPPGGP